MSLSDLGGYAASAGKKAAEMGRFFASEWLREPGAQQMLINKAEALTKPFLKKGIDQVSTAIRPKKAYKTNRNNYRMDGGSIDIHKAIMKLPKPKKGWVLPGYNYAGPGNPLEKQADFDRETGKIREYYVEPTGKTDAVAAQHDVDYTVCQNKPDPISVRRCKNEADRKMVASLDAIPYSDRQWGHSLVRNTINMKQKLGLGNG